MNTDNTDEEESGKLIPSAGSFCSDRLFSKMRCHPELAKEL
jgi:hypothetical protein